MAPCCVCPSIAADVTLPFSPQFGPEFGPKSNGILAFDSPRSALRASPRLRSVVPVRRFHIRFQCLALRSLRWT